MATVDTRRPTAVDTRRPTAVDSGPLVDAVGTVAIRPPTEVWDTVSTRRPTMPHTFDRPAALHVESAAIPAGLHMAQVVTRAA